jgi:UMF1 family MFS transporter
MSEQTFDKNNKREIFGWLTYDWANSAFFTTVVSILIQPYLTTLAQEAVGKQGVVWNFGFLGTVKAESLTTFSTGLSTLLLVFFLPILGAIADYTNLKKKLMAFFCYFGVIASSLLFFVQGENYIYGSILLMLSNMCFASANVFYNAYLVEITTEDKRDKISSYGFASGYVGGIIMLVLNLAFINFHDSFGISKGLAVRISMLSASLWWGIFALITFYLLKTRNATKTVPKNKSLITVGFIELWTTFKELKKLKYTLFFLIGYLFYNDGIQTVILLSSNFLSQELFINKGKETDESFLLFAFLIAQISALIGALVFERISRFLGAKNTILVCLSVWCGIVIFAFGILDSTFQAYIMSAFIGSVLGSTQALSRSLYSQMIPKGRESSFFGIYEISEKGTAWIGNLIFTVIFGLTGSFRYGILALIVLFIVGSLILFFTNTERAIHEAGQHTPDEAAHLHN